MPHADSPPPSSAAIDAAAAPDPPHTIAGKHLYVNDGLLTAAEVGRLVPSSPGEPLETLRARFAADGYIFLKGLLPRADVLAARRAYFSMMAPTGVLEPGTDPEAGVFVRDIEDATLFPGVGAGLPVGTKGGDAPVTAAGFAELALAAHTAPWYIGDGTQGEAPGLANHPALAAFVARFTGWAENTHAVKRTLLRNNCPGNKAVGVHYDQIFLRYGEPTALTAWVPIGDIALEGGGLIYLEGSDALGQKLEADFTAGADAAGLTDEERRSAFNRNMLRTGFLCEGPKEFRAQHGHRWLVTEYEAGDVVLHAPHQIHASTRNTDPTNVIRLGTDLRYVDKTRPYDTRWDNYFEYDDGV